MPAHRVGGNLGYTYGTCFDGKDAIRWCNPLALRGGLGAEARVERIAVPVLDETGSTSGKNETCRDGKDAIRWCNPLALRGGLGAEARVERIAVPVLDQAGLTPGKNT